MNENKKLGSLLHELGIRESKFSKMEIEFKSIKSPLQRRTVTEIENLCGIDELTTFVEKYIRSIELKDRLLLRLQLEYYRSLYWSKVNVEDDVLRLKYSKVRTKEVLERHISKRPSKYLTLLLDIVTYNINFMSKVRRLG